MTGANIVDALPPAVTPIVRNVSVLINAERGTKLAGASSVTEMQFKIALLVVPLQGCNGAVDRAEAPVGETGDASGDAQDEVVCDRAGWGEFEAQSLFNFRAPCTLHGGAEKGIDSYVGSYADDGMQLGYDFGAYSSPLTEWSSKSGYQMASVVVDTRAAYIVTASDPAASDGLTFLFGLHVPMVNADGPRLTFDGRCDTAERLGIALTILNSTSFP